MKVFITGGTGFVGRGLVELLVSRGCAVTVLTRQARPATDGVRYVAGDPLQLGPWMDEVAGHAAVVNLAGAPIFCRWTEANKAMLRASRITTTHNLVAALARNAGQEVTLLNASAVGYYGLEDYPERHETAPAGHDFLARLARDWEAAARGAEGSGVRVVLCRFGVVLDPAGGALRTMLPAFRLGLGSPLGSGRQWFPWISRVDLLEAFWFLLQHQDIAGPVNCTAPHTPRNREFVRLLGRSLHRPVFLPGVPAWLLRLLLGEAASTITRGQNVVPAVLMRHGFRFRHPTVADFFRQGP
ncbi:MAG: TIGR01777 family protein [Deltaproteobacteria bacterium CG_4_10_14_3_um_filter_60_8]|nr:MAG: TIGR01777 family protein [Desulfobacterales bacterium CG2_30_60_27]PIY21285.1 MAG: TIGR01777 family protein [Deltaproteobacteria bacterium CG_4_10_14_3_um_filter_60_8]